MLRRALAWAVHAFTASGAVAALVTVVAIGAGNVRGAFWGMLAALLIDAFDGSLARLVRVKDVLPSYDGRMLDWVIDWLNFVFVPAYWLYVSDLLRPELRWAGVVAVFLSAAYHFGNRDAVSDDGYFRGFPAFWNLVLFYLVVLGLGPLWNAALVGIFFVLHFVPVLFVYPTRVRRYRTLVWSASAVAIGCAAAIVPQYPGFQPWLANVSLAGTLTLGAVGLESTYRSLAQR